MRRAYLDANASEELRPEARAAVLAALDLGGNPSSVHADGRAARRLLENAREAIAASFGGSAAGLVFTSGGTEAIALAIHALGAGRRVIIGATEHDAVRAAAPHAAHLPVDGEGRAELAKLASMLGDAGEPAVVCLMLANNETGTIQDVAAAAELCRRAGARLVVDAVQAAGRMTVDTAMLGADALALSSHKLGGPTGAGAVLFAPSLPLDMRPLIAGGGQERGWRGGTPALAAIAGFAAAARVRPEPRLEGLRNASERAAVSVGGLVIGAGALRLPNTLCVALPGVRADTQVIALDLAGVSVSAGAACSSGKVARSHVLAAMGLGTLASEAIRVSLPWNATDSDVAMFAEAYGAMAGRLLRRAA